VNAARRVFALIPAAGKSSRMGRPKLSLPLGDRTILERAITVLRQSGIDEVLVVLGPHVADLRSLAEAAGARALILERETADMRATVEHGLTWLERQHSPQAADYLLLMPADHPTLAPDVVRGLLSAMIAHPDATILVPTHSGLRGHPVLIAWKHVADIRALPADQGINVYLRQHEVETRLVPVASAEILRDVDTPDDYGRLQREYET
jgi:molybdenum cofactor cytidylyltransferase